MGGGGGTSGGSFTTRGNLSPTGRPNSSVTKLDSDGNRVQTRYYDQRGRAEKDIDYTNHGNPKTHPKVPHTHKWNWDDPNNPKRSKYDE